MELTNYTIAAIQNNPVRLEEVLGTIQDSEMNILVENCQGTVRLGNRTINRDFGTVLYSEDKDLMALFMRQGRPTAKELERMLLDRKIPFHEVSLLRNVGNPVDELGDKEICFVTNKRSLIEEIKESRDKGFDICTYYPRLLGRINLKQITDDDEEELFDSKPIKAVLDFPDKMVCVVSSGQEPSLYTKPVLNILKALDVYAILDWSKDYPEPEKGNEYKKELV